MKNKTLYCSIFTYITVAIIWNLYFSTPPATPFHVREDSLSEQQLLGKKLFEDTNLSEPRGMSCATCHEPQKAFQGNNGSRIAAIAKGSRDEHFGTRNVPSLTYAAFSPAFHFSKEKNEEGKEEWKASGGQFLDGRATDLAAQVEGPLLNEKEMNNSTKEMVVSKVKTSRYATLVQKVYGEHVFDNSDTAFANIAIAIAAYENTPAFAPFSSKFDRVLKGSDHFTTLEAQGFELFKDPQKGNCMACHVGTTDSKNPADWLFTDYTYDNLGIPRNAAIPENADKSYYDLGLCKQKNIEKIAPQEIDNKGLCGAFKVPTLRNIALTAPYGHNGFFNTLRDIVKFYATRDTNPELWYPTNADGTVNKYDDLPKEFHGNVNVTEVPYDRKPGEKPRLNDEEIDALVAFLNTLTDQADR